jgi:hypothetical protein
VCAWGSSRDSCRHSSLLLFSRPRTRTRK